MGANSILILGGIIPGDGLEKSLATFKQEALALNSKPLWATLQFYSYQSSNGTELTAELSLNSAWSSPARPQNSNFLFG